MEYKNAPRSEYQRLSSYVEYRPDEGRFYWRRRDEATDFGASAFNARYAGKPIFERSTQSYPRIRVNKLELPCHRFAWFIMTGQHADTLDHINRDKRDYRWSNLRAASPLENMWNKPRDLDKSIIVTTTLS
jgi:hypothetical protein